MVRGTWLWCRKSLEGCEFKAGLCNVTGKLSVNPAEKGHFFLEFGKDKALKGDGWAPLITCCAQDMVGF